MTVCESAPTAMAIGRRTGRAAAAALVGGLALVGLIGCEQQGPSSASGDRGRAAPEIKAEQWLNVPSELTGAAKADASKVDTGKVDTGKAGASKAGSGKADSASVSLAKLRGRVVVVEFWATWCPPCRESIPHLNELSRKYASKEVVFIGLTDESAGTVEPFAKKLKMEYVIGVGSRSSGAYGVRGIPTAFVVDRSGQIVWSGHPMDDKFVPAIDAALSASETAPTAGKTALR